MFSILAEYLHARGYTKIAREEGLPWFTYSGETPKGIFAAVIAPEPINKEDAMRLTSKVRAPHLILVTPGTSSPAARTHILENYTKVEFIDPSLVQFNILTHVFQPRWSKCEALPPYTKPEQLRRLPVDDSVAVIYGYEVGDVLKAERPCPLSGLSVDYYHVTNA